MKKLNVFYFVLFTIITNSFFSQNNYQVKYKMTTLFDGLKNYETKLTFSQQDSSFEYKIFDKDTATIEHEDINGNKTIVISNKRQHSISINLKEKKIRELKYFKSPYLVEDTLSFPNWDITNEIKIINNHQCQKATTFYKGRWYEVWFTNEYPTIFGPWKLNGLPGLIILAQDKKSEVFFEAIEIKKIVDNVNQIDTNIKQISKQELEKIIKKWQKDYEERIKSMGDRSIKFDIKFGKAADIEILD